LLLDSHRLLLIQYIPKYLRMIITLPRNFCILTDAFCGIYLEFANRGEHPSPLNEAMITHSPTVKADSWLKEQCSYQVIEPFDTSALIFINGTYSCSKHHAILFIVSTTIEINHIKLANKVHIITIT